MAHSPVYTNEYIKDFGVFEDHVDDWLEGGDGLDGEPTQYKLYDSVFAEKATPG